MSENVYIESSNTLPVYDTCDVLVVGGGAAGHSAAVAAARAGAGKVILMERYGYFGGNVTGGYVLMLPALSWRKYSMVRGIQEEWFTRLDKSAPGTYIAPPFDQLGSTDPMILHRWDSIHGCTNPLSSTYNRVIRAPYFEPNQLKIEMDEMVREQENIKVMVHCWGTKPIMEGNKITGVIFESKEGRKCVMAKIVIDATGDGDIYSQAGAEYTEERRPNSSVDHTALVWRIGGCDFEAYCEWRKANPQLNAAFIKNLSQVAGYKTSFYTDGRNDVVWVNNWLTGRSCIKLDDMRETEFTVRASIRRVLAYIKEMLPFAFKDAFIYDIAPQLGTRGGRRLVGDYTVTYLDIACGKHFDDVIAWHSLLHYANDGVPFEIPYSCLLPKGVENLICPGRHLAADDRAICLLYLIPQCVGTGQAAGVAAAVATQEGTTARNVNIKRVQEILAYEQDVPLPRMKNTDPELVKELEECKYGTETTNAKKIREEYGLDW